VGKLGDFLKLDDGQKHIPGRGDRRANVSSRRGNSSGRGRAVPSLLITFLGGCGVCLSIVGIARTADWGFLALDTGGHPNVGSDIFTLLGPFVWILPLVLSLAAFLFGLHLLAEVVRDATRRRPSSLEDERTHSVILFNRLGESIIDGGNQDSSSHTGMSHRQQEVTPSNHAPNQESQLPKCPVCYKTPLRIVKKSGALRCSNCLSVLHSYSQGNE